MFSDRADAGRLLGRLVAAEADRWRSPLLVAIPAGGVPVAVAMAEVLGWSVDVAVVSKVTPRWNPEVGYGAVAWDGAVVVDDGLARAWGLTPGDVAADVARTEERVRRRLESLRAGRLPEVAGRSVVLVDDGLASGVTMRVAAAAVGRLGPARVGAAVPTGHLPSVEALASEVEIVWCPNLGTGPTFAVADAYSEWYDVPDEEVAELLQAGS